MIQECNKLQTRLDVLSQREDSVEIAVSVARKLKLKRQQLEQAAADLAALSGLMLKVSKKSGGFRLSKRERASLDAASLEQFYIANRELAALQRANEELRSYCDVLPVLGFNSGRFDMKLLRPWLIPYLQEQQLDVSAL